MAEAFTGDEKSMNITIYSAQGIREAAPADLPELLASQTDTLWVDMTGPDEDDLTVMRDVFHFHPLAIEDTTNQQQRPKIEEYADHLFLILNPIACYGSEIEFRELDVFVGSNFVVSVHREEEPVVAEARRRVPPAGNGPSMSPSYLLYTLMDATIDAYFPVVDALGDLIEDIENEVLTEPRQAALARLFHSKRTMIELWRVVWPQREVLNVLIHHKLPYIEQETLQYYLRDISDHLLWLADMVNTFRDSLMSVTDLYMSAVSNQLNRVVNRLTVFALAVGALTVVGGFYGMNFTQTWPPFDAPWGVPLVLGMMAVTTGGLLLLLRRLEWF